VASRGARRLTIAGIVLAILVVLLVVADRVGAYVAERVAAGRIQTAEDLRNRPSVDVAGFPFLTQLAAGEFDQITVRASDVPVGTSGHRATLTSLVTVLHHVNTSGGFHRVHARTLTATGSTTLSQVADATGLPLHYAGHGRVAAQRSVTVLGRTLDATVSARPVVRDGALVFTDPRIDGGGSLLGEVSQQLLSPFDVSVSLAGLPFDLRADSVAVTGSTVTITLTGVDVTLTD